MNTNNNFIMGDVSAIKTKGIRYLLSDYFWPVSDNDFKNFIKHMHYEYLDIVNSIDDEDVRNIAIVEISFIAKLQQIFHYNYVKNYSKDNNIDLIFGKLSEEFYNPNWRFISQQYTTNQYMPLKIKSFIKSLVKNILFNKHIAVGDYIKNIIFGSSVVGIGSNDLLKKEFVKKNNLFCNHVDVWNLCNVGVINDNELSKISSRLYNEVVTPYICKLQNSNIKFVKNIDMDIVKNTWITRFNDAASIYLNIVNKDKVLSSLLVTELSKPIHKLVTVAYQRVGSDVYCFHHGHDTAVITHSIGHDITSLHCLKYVVPSYGISNKYNKIYPHLNTKYYSTNSNWYKSKLKKNNTKTNKANKKIMIVGFPLNPIRYVDGDSSFFYSRIDLEYRLMTFLKKNGYSIMYKAHPDRLSEAIGLYDDIVDEIISLPFEKVVNLADCLLFTHSSSTTFGYALLSNKPIFLIDIESANFDIDSYSMLKKRVNMIPSCVAKSTRILFDKDSMLEKLNYNYTSVQNDDYVKNMFFNSAK